MKLTELCAAIEAMLFSVGEPVEADKLAGALGQDEIIVKQQLEELEKYYSERGGGIELLRLGEKYQLCSAAKYVPQVRSLMQIKSNAPLSQAAFEVLAVVAYNQPVTRAYIDKVRGVDCSAAVSSLVKRELIEECGRLDLPGRPLLYRTTTNFLRCFSLSCLEDLPEPPARSEEPSEGGENAAES